MRESIQGPVDLVLESSGAGAALDEALHVVKRGGGITLIGMPSRNIELDLAQALRAEIALRASYFGTWHDFDRALRPHRRWHHTRGATGQLLLAG